MYTDIQHEISSIKAFKNAEVFRVNGSKTLMVEATGTYIPIEEFKQIFSYIGEVTQKEKIEKLIFDKRNLTVFHQPSMEWYFVHWKEDMAKHGLNTHRKLLPDDQVFVQSVNIGREQIANKYPQGKFNQMDIQYMNTIDDAIEK